MSGSLTNYAENKMLDSSVGLTTAGWPPAATYCGLFTVSPDDVATGTEVGIGTGGYARQLITWTPSSGGLLINGTAITFPTAGTNWGEIVAIAVIDSAAASLDTAHMIWYGSVDNTPTIQTGDVFRISAGNLSIALD